MTTDTLHKLIWALIYGGLLAVALGIAVARTDGHLGWGISTSGGLATAAGVILIFVRSRIKDQA